MTIYSVLQIGEYHLNHCEDYLFTGELNKNITLCAVMDGCTMANESYFASALVGKLLRKIVKERSYKEFYGGQKFQDLDDCLRSIVRQLFDELNILKNQLLLEQRDLLTTLILLLLDKNKDKGIVLVVGDGFVNINDKAYEFDHDNKPDYLGFHLSEDFDQWFTRLNQKIIFQEIRDITIATDGIFSFSPVVKPDHDKRIDAIQFLVSDPFNKDKEDMLEKKLKVLEYEHGLKPADDLALIRIIV